MLSYEPGACTFICIGCSVAIYHTKGFHVSKFTFTKTELQEFLKFFVGLSALSILANLTALH
jgi:hypothetical protein